MKNGRRIKWKASQFLNYFILSLEKVFVRSLFALCSLIVRSIGEGTAVKLNLYSF